MVHDAPDSVTTPGWLIEVAIVLGLMVLALAIRWPHLWAIPLWTDEGDEAVIAARIVRFGALPLSNDNGYNGPIFNYLVAVGLWLFGSHHWVPRLVTYVLGALTVVPTYLLAREILLAGPPLAALGALRHRAMRHRAMRHRAMLVAGLAAGLLLGLNAAHIVVNSHIGWGHCLTPLFTTTAVWLLRRAIRLRTEAAPSGCRAGRAGGPSLVLSGLFWSLAFQSHPTVAVLLPAVVLFMLWKHREWLLTPWPYLAGLAFVAGQAPTILNSVQRGELVWLSAGLDQRSIYDGSEHDSLRGYATSLLGAVQSLGASLAGLLNDHDTPAAPIWNPLLVLGLLVTVVALCWLWWSGRPLAALLGISLLLGLPYLHGQFEPIVSRSRYVAPIVPVLLAAWAACAVEAWAARSGAAHGKPDQGKPDQGKPDQGKPDQAQPGRDRLPALLAGRGRTPGLAPLLAVALMVLAAGSVGSLAAYYDGAVSVGRTNTRLLDDYQQLLAARRPGELVAVDRALLRDWTLTQGRLGRVVSQWLELDEIPYTGIDLLPDGRFSGGRQEIGGLVVLARGNIARAAAAYSLEEIATNAAPNSPPDRGYTIVRARRRA